MTSQSKVRTNGRRLTRRELDAAIADAEDTGKAEVPPEKITLEVPRPNFVTFTFIVKGLSPYMQNAWTAKAIKQLIDNMEEGTPTGETRKKRPPKDMRAAFEGAHHRATAGWVGVPCSAIRAALISACRAARLKMTHMKQAIVDVEADGYDAVTSQGLIRLNSKRAPERNQLPVRLRSGGTDVHPRPLWREWGFEVRITVDIDMVNKINLGNLLLRAGRQVGIGEGRPDSPKSHGLGFGTFLVMGL